MVDRSATLPTRLIVAGFIMTILGGLWDVRLWHANIQIESVLQWTHNIVYIGTFLAVVGAIWGWAIMRNTAWKRLTLALLLVPGFGLLDVLSHELFGVELDGSLEIYWGLPHDLLIISLMASAVLLLPLLKEHELRRNLQLFSGAIALTLLFEVLVFSLWPLRPTGIFRVAGNWGAPIEPALFVFALLYAQKKLKVQYSGTLFVSTVVIFELLIFITGVFYFERLEIEHDTWRRLLGGHFHAPLWLRGGAYLLCAFIADRFHPRPLWLYGFIVGCIVGSMTYPLALPFLAEDYMFFTTTQAIFAALASGVAGAVVGATLSLCKFYD